MYLAVLVGGIGLAATCTLPPTGDASAPTFWLRWQRLGRGRLYLPCLPCLLYLLYLRYLRYLRDLRYLRYLRDLRDLRYLRYLCTHYSHYLHHTHTTLTLHRHYTDYTYCTYTHLPHLPIMHSQAELRREAARAARARKGAVARRGESRPSVLGTTQTAARETTPHATCELHGPQPRRLCRPCEARRRRDCNLDPIAPISAPARGTICELAPLALCARGGLRLLQCL